MQDGRPPRSGWVLAPEVAPEPAPGYAFVGFWRRFWAFVLDQLILTVPTAILFFAAILNPLASGTFAFFNTARLVRDPATGLFIPNPATSSSAGVALLDMLRWVALAWVLIFALQFVYHAGFWSRLGGTPGQLLLGIQIRSEVDGERISFKRACARYFGFLVSTWFLYIGLIWVAFDPRKQGWHDKIAGTVAVRRID